MIESIDEKNFDEKIKAGLCIVDCYAPWCGTCRLMLPAFEQLSEKKPGCVFFKVNLDQNETITNRFAISTLPTFIVFRDGKDVDRQVGYKKIGDLSQLIDNNL